MSPIAFPESLITEETLETIDALIAKARVSLADGVVESMVLVAGTAAQCGLAPEKHRIDALAELRGYVLMTIQEHLDRDDFDGLARSLAMMEYVIRGVGAVHRIPYEECFEEVHGTNMAKRMPDGLVLKDAGGKILKPEGWKPPSLEPIIDAYDMAAREIMQAYGLDNDWLDGGF